MNLFQFMFYTSKRKQWEEIQRMDLERHRLKMAVIAADNKIRLQIKELSNPVKLSEGEIISHLPPNVDYTLVNIKQWYCLAANAERDFYRKKLEELQQEITLAFNGIATDE